jgi:hypothetical protein
MRTGALRSVLSHLRKNKISHKTSRCLFPKEKRGVITKLKETD